ncbi:hypothetical protein BHE74_00047161 [Ensete ventricosum]|uniref:Uncharacterized protein n=1 Tax=Ensete ventricosum TaxID=4639 RepID=A0A444FPD2_ENSVE|nr:hypothetical protein B296_00039727 [Ensete ventricosum]RWW24500.1 hypothetical protein GW17_00011209 [Ensete ventricosum]RWW46897.1 hypothetical protein BHE74_00047161 [Ensete ventricosum]RZR91918.1 hypothetical protein BHM03_00020112 [Ensete ventricosum]
MHNTRGSMKRASKLRAYSYLQIPQFRPKVEDTPPKRASSFSRSLNSRRRNRASGAGRADWEEAIQEEVAALIEGFRALDQADPFATATTKNRGFEISRYI